MSEPFDRLLRGPRRLAGVDEQFVPAWLRRTQGERGDVFVLVMVLA